MQGVAKAALFFMSFANQNLCSTFVIASSNRSGLQMDYLEHFLLEVVKEHLKSLSDAEFLALTCDQTKLHDGLIRQVYNQACSRHFRAPIRVSADVFGCSKRNITKYLRRTWWILQTRNYSSALPIQKPVISQRISTGESPDTNNYRQALVII